MDYQDYYQTLGLTRNASQPEIKKAFRKLAREHHPDKRPGDTAAERRFKEINEANAVLSDPEKRRKYDLLGANWESYSQAGAGGASAGANPFAGFGRGAGGQAGNVRYEFRTSGGAGGGFSDFFRTFFAGDEPGAASAGRSRQAGPTFEEILGQMGLNEAAQTNGAAGRRQAASPVVAEATAEISLEEAFRGTTRRIDIDGKRLEMTIPPGADNGTRIKLTGQGRRWWRRRRRRPRPAPRHLHPARRRPRTRAPDHPAGSAARRRSPGKDAQGPGVAEDPAGHAERP